MPYHDYSLLREIDPFDPQSPPPPKTLTDALHAHNGRLSIFQGRMGDETFLIIASRRKVAKKALELLLSSAETHFASKKLNDQDLSDIARCYLVCGKTEEGGFFVSDLFKNPETKQIMLDILERKKGTEWPFQLFLTEVPSSKPCPFKPILLSPPQPVMAPRVHACG